MEYPARDCASAAMERHYAPVPCDQPPAAPSGRKPRWPRWATGLAALASLALLSAGASRLILRQAGGTQRLPSRSSPEGKYGEPGTAQSTVAQPVTADAGNAGGGSWPYGSASSPGASQGGYAVTAQPAYGAPAAAGGGGYGPDGRAQQQGYAEPEPSGQSGIAEGGAAGATAYGGSYGEPAVTPVSAVATSTYQPLATVPPVATAPAQPVAHINKWLPPTPGTSLFCYALMVPMSYERGLLAAQRQRSVSLFACNEFAVYSNQSIQLSADVWTNVVDVSLQCKYGGEFKTALNNDIFLAVWKQVVKDGRFAFHDWTVKVDPDAVFLPERLRTLLQGTKEGPRGVYLANCVMGMHGPLEVLSRTAVTMWYTGIPVCVQHFKMVCSGDCFWGEDMFLDQCLMKVLNVTRLKMWGMLIEDHCNPPSNWKSCFNSSAVAFHPFKKAAEYGACLKNAHSVAYTPTKPFRGTVPPPRMRPGAHPGMQKQHAPMVSAHMDHLPKGLPVLAPDPGTVRAPQPKASAVLRPAPRTAAPKGGPHSGPAASAKPHPGGPAAHDQQHPAGHASPGAPATKPAAADQTTVAGQ